MKSRRFRLAGFELGLTDVVTFGGLVILTSLAVAFNARLAHPRFVLISGFAFIAFYLASLAVLRRLKPRWLRFLIRTGSVQLTFLQIYKTSNELQRLFFPWQDDRVLAWEKAILGFQPLVAIQKFYTVGLTEWMFFVYVAYVIIYPVLGAILFFKHGEEANEDYLFHLGLINLICGLGFILFPVASPMNWPKIRTLLTAPLEGRFFGIVAEWIRANVHQPGGAIPSPHCAVATVMWFMSLKYTRRGFIWLSPVMISLYLSTVYGRFHYLSDMVLGIVAGLLVILIAPWIERAWNGRPGADPGDAP